MYTGIGSLPRLSAGAFLAVLLAFCGAAKAEETRVPLPLMAPAGAHPLVADFIEICSLAVIDREEAAAEADRRGFADMSGGSELEAAFNEAGNYTLTKIAEGEDDAFILVVRTVFPHLTRTDCTVQTVGTTILEGMDPTVVAAIDGVLAGENPFDAINPAAGDWSFIDGEGEIVTISSIPLLKNVSLLMSRATNGLSGPATDR